MSLHFLIDGYNIIKQDCSLSAIRSLKDARCALVKDIETRQLLGSQNNQATIVFDGKDNFNFDLKQGKEPVNIIFSKGESADEVIKKIIQDSGKPKQMAVVSDDKEIIFFSRSLGAKTVSVAEFIKKGQKQLYAKKQKINKNAESLKMELTYEQQEAINQELRRLWK